MSQELGEYLLAMLMIRRQTRLASGRKFRFEERPFYRSPDESTSSFTLSQVK